MTFCTTDKTATACQLYLSFIVPSTLLDSCMLLSLNVLFWYLHVYIN